MPDRSRRKAAKNSSVPISKPQATSAPRQQLAQPANMLWYNRLRVLRPALPVAGLVAVLLAGLVFGLGTALLVLAAITLLIAISALWSSLQLIAGDASDSLPEVDLLLTPGTEYEQKRAVLRALKDLEFERSLGKISEQDYAELKERYRTKARAVLQSLDREVEPVRGEAEKLVAEYLANHGFQNTPAESHAPPSSGAEPSAPAVSSSANKTTEVKSSGSTEVRTCPSCSTRNDSDAAFCKKCGQHLVQGQRSTALAET
jgi:hypothetical protein